jgi:spermidine/putrescine transport system ATP-binding protein
MSQGGLEVERVRKQYAGFTAVQQLSFRVEPGKFFSILGPSGCGKTTLLRMIGGFLDPDAGDIRIAGKSQIGVPPNRRPVNLVFQHLALFPMMSVGENVAYGLARRGVPHARAQDQAAAMLARVGLPGSAGKRVDQLSGGQRQRVALARCLVLEPSLLLLDEPLGALDLKLREQMKVELKQLQADFGTTFVYITHDQSEALVLSDQLAVMNGGRFEQVGTPEEVYHAPASAFVAGFVGEANRANGTVIALRGDRGDVQLEGGLRVVVRCAAGVAPGCKAQVFLRPEAIRLESNRQDASESDTAIQGTVDAALFDGAHSTLLVRAQGVEAGLRVAWPEGATGAYPRGTPIRLAIRAGAGWAFAQ